jgi:O-acetyl-ADP-ribose deacetylase (regulator of RNase III)
LAERHGFRTLAFPSISTGVYGYPIDAAARIALETIGRRLTESPGRFDEVRLVLFSAGDLAVYTTTREDLGY